jgi:hypothetical protein
VLHLQDCITDMYEVSDRHLHYIHSRNEVWIGEGSHMFCQRIEWIKCVFVSILQSTFPHKSIHFNCATTEDACILRASFCVGDTMSLQ